MMQWFVNEVREKFAEIGNKVDAAITSWAKGQIEDAERLSKLEGELKAMKARMGKNKE
jgi:hypothetical protein